MLSRLQARFSRFWKREDGPTAVEYAVMLALIVVVCISAITAVGGNAAAIFGLASNAAGSNGYGQSYPDGTSVSSGTFSQTDEWGNQLTYNASTGEFTVAYNNGPTESEQLPAGQLPTWNNGTNSWTQTGP